MNDTGLVQNVQMFSTGMLVAYSVLHLALYLQQRENRTNLYFAISILLAAAAAYLDFETEFADGAVETNLLRFQRLAIVGFVYTLYVVVGTLFDALDRRVVRVGAVVCTALAIGGFIEPLTAIPIFFVVLAVTFILIGRMIVRAIGKGKANARILAVGLGLLLLSFGYDAVLELLFPDAHISITNGYPFGVIALLFATSITLARDTADTQRRLIEEEQTRRTAELERQLAETQLERRRHDLDEARKLQQSFLPEGPPDVPFLDVAFSQQMALEVGGDYYDYHVLGPDRVLLALGDATGHGTRGGLMVAAAKSLFQTADREAPPSEILSQASQAIKQMRLQSMFMGLSVARLEPGRMTVASAGMPPVLVRRNATGTVEQIVHKTMPLGAFKDFAYEETSVSLEPGDVVVLQSDGLTECFNEERELLGLDRIADALGRSTAESADAVLADLRARAHRWCGEKPYDDDMTIAVVRYLA